MARCIGAAPRPGPVVARMAAGLALLLWLAPIAPAQAEVIRAVFTGIEMRSVQIGAGSQTDAGNAGRKVTWVLTYDTDARTGTSRTRSDYELFDVVSDTGLWQSVPAMTSELTLGDTTYRLDPAGAALQISSRRWISALAEAGAYDYEELDVTLHGRLAGPEPEAAASVSARVSATPLFSQTAGQAVSVAVDDGHSLRSDARFSLQGPATEGGASVVYWTVTSLTLAPLAPKPAAAPALIVLLAGAWALRRRRI